MVRNSLSTEKNTIQELGMTSYDMSVSINLAHRAFKKLLSTCLSHHGLSTPEWTLLGKLYNDGATRPVELAKILGSTPPHITKLIEKVQRKGFITSHIFADDARGKTIALTPLGRELVENVEVKLEHCLNEQFHDVAQNDLETYFSLMKHIAKNVRHHE